MSASPPFPLGFFEGFWPLPLPFEESWPLFFEESVPLLFALSGPLPGWASGPSPTLRLSPRGRGSLCAKGIGSEVTHASGAGGASGWATYGFPTGFIGTSCGCTTAASLGARTSAGSLGIVSAPPGAPALSPLELSAPACPSAGDAMTTSAAGAPAPSTAIASGPAAAGASCVCSAPAGAPRIACASPMPLSIRRRFAVWPRCPYVNVMAGPGAHAPLEPRSRSGRPVRRY